MALRQERNVISVPPAEERFVGMMYRLFSYSNRETSLRLNYIEIVSTDTASQWRIEYRYNSARKYQLAAFIDELHQALGWFETTGIWQNTSGRIYIHVVSSTNIQSTSTRKTYKVKPSPSAKKRNAKRAEDFRARVAELKDQAVKEGFKEQDKTFIPMTERKRHYEDHLNKVKQARLPKVPFVSGGIQTVSPSPILITSKGSQTDEQPQTPSAITPKPKSQNLQPAAAIVQLSAASNDQMYAKGKLRDSRIFERVRRYLAIFCGDSEYSYVDSQGESRLSLEVKISSEGFPLGAELKSMYYSALEERGMKREHIDNDLASLRGFEQTSRLIRVQTAREKTQNWYGKNGNLVRPVYMSYFEIQNLYQSNTRRSEVLIKDQLGEIPCFA